jgi:hypothetical protein
MGSPTIWAHNFDGKKITTGTPSYDEMFKIPSEPLSEPPKNTGVNPKVVVVAVLMFLLTSGCSSRVDCWVQAGF